MKTTPLIFFIFTLILAGCAGRESKSGGKNSGYVPLSEAEAKVYTTPTIYYVPQYDLAEQTCEVSSRRPMKAKDGSVLFMVCESIYGSCLLQGTCEIKNEQGRVLVNIAGKENSEYKFSKVQNKICKYGYGAGKAVCLDPFYSVAADLTIYRLGQVIYIPTMVGLQLPDGTKHDGYFIVRDSGGNIKGYGRFDFFTGFFSNHKVSNPFAQIGFAGKETHVLYYVMKAEEALNILKKRNYPSLPVTN